MADGMKHVWVKTSDVVNSDLWRLFPVINVDKVKEIPCDYPGAMGVPITIFGKLCREQFEVLDSARPVIGGRALYQRVIIRHLKPDLPEVIDLTDWLDRTGSKYEIIGLENQFPKREDVQGREQHRPDA